MKLLLSVLARNCHIKKTFALSSNAFESTCYNLRPIKFGNNLIIFYHSKAKTYQMTLQCFHLLFYITANLNACNCLSQFRFSQAPDKPKLNPALLFSFEVSHLRHYWAWNKSCDINDTLFITKPKLNVFCFFRLPKCLTNSVPACEVFRSYSTVNKKMNH